MANKISILFFLGVVLTMEVTAGGAPGVGGIVFDPTNLAENITSATHSVKSYATQLSQLRNQYDQYSTMLQQLKRGDPRILLQAMESTPELAELNRINAAISATTSLGSSISQVQTTLTRRFDEARTRKLSWSEYVAFERNAALRRETLAIKRVQQERMILERVEADYQYARNTASQIPSTASTNAALDLVNSTMNRLIQQTAAGARDLAAIQSVNAAEAAHKAEEEATAKRLIEQAAAEMEARKALDREAIKNLKFK